MSRGAEDFPDHREPDLIREIVAYLGSAEVINSIAAVQAGLTADSEDHVRSMPDSGDGGDAGTRVVHFTGDAELRVQDLARKLNTDERGAVAQAISDILWYYRLREAGSRVLIAESNRRIFEILPYGTLE